MCISLYLVTYVLFCSQMCVRDSIVGNLTRSNKVICTIDIVTHLCFIYLTVLSKQFLFSFSFFDVHSVERIHPYILIWCIVSICLSTRLFITYNRRLDSNEDSPTNYSPIIVYLLYLFSIRPHYNNYYIGEVIATDNWSIIAFIVLRKNDDVFDWPSKSLKGIHC